MYITRIETNIRTPGGVTYDDLSPKVFITGPNGAGKTSIMNAIELALTGEAHDLGGRDKAKTAAVLEGLIPDGEDRAYAYISLSNGTTAHWEMERGKRPSRATHGSVVKTYFLQPEVQAALTGSKATTLRFLGRYFLSGEIGQEPNLGTWSTVATDLPLNERLLTVEEAARKSASSHASEARALAAALDQLGGTDVPEKTIMASAIVTLVKFQLKHSLTSCGVCGSDVTLKQLTERGHKAQELVGEATFSGHIAALQNAHALAVHRTTEAKKVAAHCLEMLEVLINSRQKFITTEINRHRAAKIPPISFKMEKSRIVFGFDSKEFHPMVSGAEYILLSTALGAAAAGQLPFSALKVITTPDKALDFESLTALLKALKGVPDTVGSFIVQSPIQPRGRPSALWTRIKLSPSKPQVDGPLAALPW